MNPNELSDTAITKIISDIKISKLMPEFAKLAVGLKMGNLDIVSFCMKLMASTLMNLRIQSTESNFTPDKLLDVFLRGTLVEYEIVKKVYDSDPELQKKVKSMLTGNIIDIDSIKEGRFNN
jgi:hypothetical protein